MSEEAQEGLAVNNEVSGHSGSCSEVSEKARSVGYADENAIDSDSLAPEMSAAENPQRFSGRDGSLSIRRTSTAASDVHLQSVEADRELARVLSGSARTQASRRPLPPMGGDKDYPPPVPDHDLYRVEFDGFDDPTNPLNWSLTRKLVTSMCIVICSLSVSFGSSVYSGAMPFIEKDYHVAEVVAALGISLYVGGFAFGPIVWGPLSEVYGRQKPLIIGMTGAVCFCFAVATAKDLQTIMICRFFMGSFGSSTVAIVPAIFADMFTTSTRGLAMILFSMVVFGGPFISPVVSAFVSNSFLGWRWTHYLTGFMASLGLCAVVFIFQETYRPMILTEKARELRLRTGNWGIFAEHETVELDIKEMFSNTVARPIKMLIREPILVLMSLYAGYIYGLLYALLEIVPIIFEGQYHWRPGVASLPYVSIFIGTLTAGLISAFIFEPRFQRKLAASGKFVLPEERLPAVMVGGVVFPIAIFWVSWCGAYAKHVHWLAPVFGFSLVGYGILAIFLGVLNYIIDTYLKLAASGMAANAFTRAGMAIAFPLFAAQMFHNLGIQWAGTLLGCLAALMTPVPFAFYKYGPWLRANSPFATG